MLQDWFARRFPNRSPYRLYVLSNVGSLLALGVYPLYLERYLDLRPQAVVWSAGFAAFVLVCAWCAQSMRATSADSVVTPPLDDHAPVGAIDRLLWIVLPAFGSGLLVATTNSLTQDVAAVPLIWIVPLALYLVTFILAFAGWYWRWAWGSALVILLAAAVIYANSDSETPILLQGIALVAAFTAAAMVCHGELAQLRPSPASLTAFYLAISIGGSAGAAFVTLVAPVLFTWYLELPLLFMVTVAALLALGCRDLAREHSRVLAGIAAVVCAGALFYVGAIVLRPLQREGLVGSGRGYYGMLRVFDEGPEEKRVRKLWHGRIVHGVQVLVPPELGRQARSYYAPGSGIATGGRPASAARSGPAPQDRSRRARVRDRGRARAAVRSHPFLRDRPAGRPILESVLHVSQRLAREDRGLSGRRAALARARDGV